MPKNTKNAPGTTKRHVGRPRAEVTYPKGEFTKRDAFIHNGALKKDGSTWTTKEKKAGHQRMVTLTVLNAMDRERFINKGSKKNPKWVSNPATRLIQLEKLGTNESDNGKGRKPYLFVWKGKVTVKAKSKKTIKVKRSACPPVNVPIPSAITTAPVTPIPTPVPTPAPVPA